MFLFLLVYYYKLMMVMRFIDPGYCITICKRARFIKISGNLPTLLVDVEVFLPLLT